MVRTKPLAATDAPHEPRSIGGIARAADLRFESVLESDLLQLFTVLDREPRIDRAGTMTSTEVEYAMRDRLERFGWTADLVRSRALHYRRDSPGWPDGRQPPFSRRRCTICPDTSRTIGAGEINSERRD